MTTLHDVAKLAGVSSKTVSNVMNDHPNVRPKTRARVDAAIAQLGYRPNHAARALRRGRTGVIGLAVPEIDLPYFGGLASAIIEAADAHGLVVMIEQTSHSRAREINALVGPRRQMTDGLIISPLTLTESDLDLITERSPLVLLGEHLFTDRVDHVTMQNESAGAAATEHLISLGHTRIIALGGDAGYVEDRPGRDVADHRAARLRYQGYRQALFRHGIPVDSRLVVPAEPWRRRDGAESIRTLLAEGVEFSGIFAFNDTLALGALHELQLRGISVPDDISIIGFDNIDDASYSAPTLTTIDPGWREIAAASVQALVDRLANPAGAPRLIYTDFSLVARNSTARAPTS